MCPALTYDQSRDIEHGPLRFSVSGRACCDLQVILRTLPFASHQHRLLNSRIMSTTT